MGRDRAWGTVYLVGAGPGDPELLTLKGARLLSEADAVVYDALISPELLARVPEKAERWFAGKRGGEHYLPQEEINVLLVGLAARLDVIVRLKGGDPYLFGRGAEEQEHLVRHGVPVVTVPGVSSALAVPASVGIPLTHRDHASMAVIATGHRREDQVSPHVDWGQLGRLPATISVLMAMKNLDEVVAGLLEGGRSPGTGAALIEWGTTERQRVTIATLESIVERARRARVAPPAVLVIGDVVHIRQRLGYE
jgi:uroporphyrin-III C-methyltransferase